MKKLLDYEKSNENLIVEGFQQMKNDYNNIMINKKNDNFKEEEF